MAETVVLDAPLDAGQVVRIAEGARLELSAAARARIRHTRAIVDSVVARGIRGYGINTGVGALCDVIVSPEDQGRLSRNIVFSHACGVGDPLPRPQTRAIMAAQINNFAHGRSGLRLEVVETLLALLNADILPVIPSRGSVGYITCAAAIGLVAIGAGEATAADGRRVPGAEALRIAGRPPLTLAAKEGLSLVNGTPCVSGLGSIAIQRAQHLLDWADAAAALCQAILGRQPVLFPPEGMALRRSEGLNDTAARLRRAVAGSVAEGRPTTQDPMSLRAVPHIHGAVRDSLRHVAAVVDAELQSATDNPLIGGSVDAPLVFSQAHAVASAMGFAMDQLAILIAQICATSERRVDRLVNPLVSGLPAFLSADSGVGSGFMIAQYTAVALVGENRRLAAPASLDGGITSALQEDVLPHATPAAEKALRVIDNLQTVLAIELCCAAQAVDLAGGDLRLGPSVQRLFDQIRSVVPGYQDDRPLNHDFAKVARLLDTSAPVIA